VNLLIYLDFTIVAVRRVAVSLSLQIVNFGFVIISSSFYWICFTFSVQTVYFALVIVSSLGVFMLNTI
jgi:hypothetical protein